MKITALALPDVKLIEPPKFGDDRGFFSETYNQQKFKEAGLDLTFVQDNQSLSAKRGTLRGLHFQLPPFAQDKLVRVTRGAILDIAIDIRKNSPTFGQHVKEVLSAENWRQLLVPVGFAHAFLTLEENTEVLYKVTNFYSPEHDRGLAWNDPTLNISWHSEGFPAQDPSSFTLSDKDQKHPLLKDLPQAF